MLLTYGLPWTNLLIPLPHGAGQDCSLENKRRKPLNCGIFLRKISVSHHYVGLSKALERVAGFVCSGTATLLSFQRHDCSHVVGFKTLQTEAVMPKQFNAQIPTKHNTPILSVRLKSFFLLLNADKQLIASDLGFEQVKPLADNIRGSVIKFQKFEKVGVFA